MGTRWPRPLRCRIVEWRRYGNFALRMAAICPDTHEGRRLRRGWLDDAQLVFGACSRLVLIGLPHDERARMAYGYNSADEKETERLKQIRKRARRRARRLVEGPGAGVESSAMRGEAACADR